MNARPISVLCSVLGALVLSTSAAFAAPGDLSSKFPVNDEDPTANVPTLEERAHDPLEFGYYLQDLIARAEGGFLAKDWAKAAKYYEALAKAVPDRAISFTRLCTAYAELGQFDRAAGNCAHALGLGGVTVADHFRFINVSLERQQLDPQNLADLDASIEHLREFAAAHPGAPAASTTPETRASTNTAAERAPSAAPPPVASGAASGAPRTPFEAARAALLDAEAHKKEQRAAAEHTEKVAASNANFPLEVEVAACKIAVRLKDRARLDACVGALHGLNADERVMLPFEWSQALVSGDRKHADELLARAKALTVPAAALQAMSAEQLHFFARKGVPGRSALFALIAGVFAAGGGIAWWAIWGSRRRKLAAPRRA